jgi:hypothetical protein
MWQEMNRDEGGWNMATASGSTEHLKQRIKHAHSPKSDKMKNVSNHGRVYDELCGWKTRRGN